MAISEPHVQGSLERYYYSELVKIWIQNYKAFWSAVHVFLIVESILFVALFEAAKIEDYGNWIVFLLSWVGLIVSLMWLFVCGRLRAALSLLEHQARHLEQEMFQVRKNSSNDPVNDVPCFPLYFSGSRAFFFFQKHDKIDSDQKPKCFETRIWKHHYESLSQKERFTAMNAMSYNLIVAIRLPILFIIAWIVAIAISLFSGLQNIDWDNIICFEFTNSFDILISIQITAFVIAIILLVIVLLIDTLEGKKVKGISFMQLEYDKYHRNKK